MVMMAAHQLVEFRPKQRNAAVGSQEHESGKLALH
jgi:hypothetical protein